MIMRGLLLVVALSMVASAYATRMERSQTSSQQSQVGNTNVSPERSAEEKQTPTANLVDLLIEELGHLKPLWDFLTAIGTLGLAFVTFWLATRKPRAELILSEIRAGNSVTVAIQNTGDVVLVVGRFFWSAVTPRRQAELGFNQPGFCLFNGIGPIPFLQARLSRGDTVEIRVSIEQLAEAINPHIPQEATAAEIADCLRSSHFGCVTTTGEQFQAPISEATYVDTRTRVMLLRPGNM
jgi:hypothetical protein